MAVENQRARQRGRAVVAVLRGATKRDSVFDDYIDWEHGEFDFSDGDDDRGDREGVRGEGDWSGDDCDVGVCFVILRDCAEIDRGAARVGGWEVSRDADTVDVDDFVSVGKNLYRHRGFWISFVADTDERRAVCQRKRIEVGIERSDGIEFYRGERAVDDTKCFGFIEHASKGGDDAFGANLRH